MKTLVVGAAVIGVLALGACTESTSDSDDVTQMGELISSETIPGRCCAMQLLLRYTNELDHETQIECRLEVETSDGARYPRWVTSPEPLAPGETTVFSTVSEIGIAESVEDLVLTSCEEAPD